MSRGDGEPMTRLCARCAFHGDYREAVAPDPGYPKAKLLYCQDCADYLAGRLEECRLRRENRPPPQITHHEKEAT